jgi:mRNA-degrading endonuclease RelE of RelBE toxin-antitoxin system
LEKMAEKLKKLPEKQREALESLELGARYAGRTFKRAGSQRDTPTLRRRPPAPIDTDHADENRNIGRGRR